MDKSHGYEAVAPIFIKGRGQAKDGIGASRIRNWAQTFPKHAELLDLGCGTGIPISKALRDEGLTVFGIDASQTMVKTFRQNFPDTPVACEAAEESLFFNRLFDGIVAWGLLFLLPEVAQEIIIQKSAKALRTGGRFLFTSTEKKVQWKDGMTDQLSISLGAERYQELLTASGLSLSEEFEDEGENHYFHTVKI